jgi:hypothetical protein
VTAQRDTDYAAALALAREVTVPASIYLRESLSILRSLRGGGDITDVVLSSTFLLAKPEAVVGRRLEPISRFLAANATRVVDVRSLWLDRRTVRELWRSHMARAPLAIAKMIDLNGSAGPFVMFALLGPGDSGTGPAATALSRRKGKSVPTKGDGTLRDVLHIRAPTMNFVHAPDDQTKVFDELGLLLPEPDLAEVLARLEAGTQMPPDRVSSVIADAYRLVPEHDLDWTRSLARVVPDLDDTVAARVRMSIDPSGDVPPASRSELIFPLAARTSLPVWDRLTLMAHIIGDSRVTLGLADTMKTGPR